MFFFVGESSTGNRGCHQNDIMPLLEGHLTWMIFFLCCVDWRCTCLWFYLPESRFGLLIPRAAKSNRKLLSAKSSKPPKGPRIRDVQNPFVCSMWTGWGAMVTNWKTEKPRSKRMGEGGFGAVYRGMQPDGTEIAVKAPLELGRGSTFVVFVQTCPSCHHLRLKSHVQRPANLVYQKHFHWTWWQTRANMDNVCFIDRHVRSCRMLASQVSKMRLVFLGFRPREDPPLFFGKNKDGDMIWTKYREDLIAKFFFFVKSLFPFCHSSIAALRVPVSFSLALYISIDLLEGAGAQHVSTSQLGGADGLCA